MEDSPSRRNIRLLQTHPPPQTHPRSDTSTTRRHIHCQQTHPLSDTSNTRRHIHCQTHPLSDTSTTSRHIHYQQIHPTTSNIQPPDTSTINGHIHYQTHPPSGTSTISTCPPTLSKSHHMLLASSVSTARVSMARANQIIVTLRG